MNGTEFNGRSPEMRDSPWLAAEDIEGFGDVVVTIDHVEQHHKVEFEQGRKKDIVYSVSFVGKQRRLVLNGTNRKQLQLFFGLKVADWKGKQVALYVDKRVRMAGKTVWGIRIRPELPAPDKASTEEKT